jgi:hypothetical protein
MPAVLSGLLALSWAEAKKKLWGYLAGVPVIPAVAGFVAFAPSLTADGSADS